jgi:hypothetical protein
MDNGPTIRQLCWLWIWALSARSERGISPFVAGTQETRKCERTRGPPGWPSSPSGSGRRHRPFVGAAPTTIFKRFIFARKMLTSARSRQTFWRRPRSPFSLVLPFRRFHLKC